MGRGGKVSLEEFVAYHQRLAHMQAEQARQGRISARRKAPVVPIGAPPAGRARCTALHRRARPGPGPGAALCTSRLAGG